MPIVKTDSKIYLIEKLSDSLYKDKNGFDLTFRTYDTKNECGGFQVTIQVSGCTVDCANLFLGSVTEANHAEKLVGAKIISRTTKNIVSEKFSYSKMKTKLLNIN